MFAKHFANFLLKQQLQHVIIHVTNHCNFRCEHCFIDFSPKRDLSLEKYQNLGKSVGPLFWLDIAGGEPFMRKDLTGIIESFDAKVVQIPTNGSLQKQIIERVKEFKARVKSEVTISISLDGLKESHEKIRKEPGSWDQAWKTFDALREIGGVFVKVNSVLNNKNHEEMLDLMHFVREKKPDFHSVILIRGEPLNPDYGLPPMSRLLELGPKIFEILETYDYGKGGMSAFVLRNYHRYLWNLSLRTIAEKTQVIPCLAGRAHMVVMGNGDVSSCEMLPAVGNVNRKSWQEILVSDEMKNQKVFIKEKKCHCTHNCAMLDSILFRPASTPHLLYQPVLRELSDGA